MRNLFLAFLSIPTIVIAIGITIGIVMNRPFFETFGIPLFFGFIPLLGFVISVALIFVFPNSKEWKVAAAINAVPLVLVLLLGLFFWVIGYNG